MSHRCVPPFLQLNEYVREHNLKDPENGAFAICDAKLEQLTGEKKVKIFGEPSRHFGCAVISQLDE